MEVLRAVWNSPEDAEVKMLREGSGELDVWAVPVFDNSPSPKTTQSPYERPLHAGNTLTGRCRQFSRNPSHAALQEAI
jgi:hypothetical protein